VSSDDVLGGRLDNSGDGGVENLLADEAESVMGACC
jgi:hypothetical protein